MNIIFEKLRKLIPYKTCLKEKQNDDLLIVANENGDIFYLNETSRDFYEHCNDSSTIEEIFRYMLDTYDVEEDELANDIVSMVRDLQWNNVLSLKEVVK